MGGVTRNITENILVIYKQVFIIVVSLCDIQLKFVRANCANPDQRALGRAVWSGFAILGNSV